jgi:hypothetical protein
MSNTIYSKNVIDFVTVAVEFCAFLEKEEAQPRAQWLDNMLKVLPLLYIKALLLPETLAMSDDELPTFVKESDYVRVANRVAEIMGNEDAYLDVFVEDMKYSDTPVSAFVSENIADIYQDVRNFVSVYQYELTEQMHDALYICVSNFRDYWGQKLVNSLRPLHALKYSELETLTNENGEDLWD